MYGRIIKFKTILVLCLLLITPIKIFAQSVTFTAQVGDTILTIRGFTSANSLVVFTENDSVKGTTVSLADGSFEKEFTAQDSGFHQIEVFSTDPDGVNTASIVLDIFLIAFQSYEINDIALPPSISVSSTDFEQDEVIKIFGYSKPDSYLEIEIEGPIGNLTVVQSNTSGYYEYFYEAENLQPGSYQVNVTLKGSLNEDLSSSNTLSFTISLPDQNPDNGEDGGGISVTPIPQQPEDECQYFFYNLCFFDKLGKGYIDQISEFQEILLGFIRYYQQRISNIFDINGDGIISAEDLSIALYYTKPGTYEVLGVIEDRNADIRFQEGGILGAGQKTIDNNLNFFLNLARNQFIVGGILFLVFAILVILRRVSNGDADKPNTGRKIR